MRAPKAHLTYWIEYKFESKKANQFQTKWHGELARIPMGPQKGGGAKFGAFGDDHDPINFSLDLYLYLYS